jgi:hypothetical protein
MVIRYFVAVICMVTPSVLIADQWQAPRKTNVESTNGNFRLTIVPHTDADSHPGRCRATLVHLKGSEQTTCWSRFLINKVAPVKAFVSNDGKSVVTLNEWYRADECPVVIYDEKGGLVKQHTIETLGIHDPELKLTMSMSGQWWDENSVEFFGPQQATFLIRLKTKQVLITQLTTGEVIPFKTLSEDRRKSYDRTIREIAARYVTSSDQFQRETGAILCGQERLVAQKPALRKLLHDDEFFLVGRGKRAVWHREYFVRRAARDALDAMNEPHHDVVVTMKDPDRN